MDMSMTMAHPPCQEEKDKEKGKGKSSLYFGMKRTTADAHKGYWPPISIHWYATTDLSSLLISSSDSNSGNEEIRQLSPPPTLPPTIPPSVALHRSSCVVLDSVIYIIGGSRPRKRDYPRYLPVNHSFNVFYCDTRRPEGGWKKAPPMMAARLHPAAYAVDGKIYVFGGDYEGNYPYGEVFDPESGWKPLPSLHDEGSLNSIGNTSRVMPVHHADDYGGGIGMRRGRRRCLLLHLINNKSLYSFDLNSKTWTQLDTKFGSWHDPLVSAGDLIYGYDRGRSNIFAYNVVKRRWLSNPVQGLQLNKPQVFPPYVNNDPVHLLYLGNGKFCFAWSNRSPFIYCTVFTIDVAGDQDQQATATIESFRIYDLGCNPCIHFLAL